MKKLITMLCVVSGVAGTANAATIIDTKLGQFGLEPRVTCAKWAKPWRGAKICVGSGRMEFLQHDFYLVVEGPEADGAVRNVLEEAIAAAAAAVATGIATPTPDPASRVVAAIAAAKPAFISYLKARGLERLLNQYEVRIDHRTYWS